MSVTVEPVPPPGPAPAPTRCAQCGAPMSDDQEWCLECGTARTLIHRAPDWRIATAFSVVAIAIVVAGIVVAAIGLSSSPDRVTTVRIAQPPARSASRLPRPASPVRTPATRVAAQPGVLIASWPAGLGGWTVILGTDSSRTAADVNARHIATAGTRVGVLYSSEHRSLIPGLWVVFSGRFPTAQAAEAAAARLQRAGLLAAHARMVAPPGG